jgi:hypothetical protein
VKIRTAVAVPVLLSDSSSSASSSAITVRNRTRTVGYGFQDMVFRTWDLNFGAWIFTLAVSKIETWKLLGHDFQDVGSQFCDLDITQGASQWPSATGTH